jgi:hypothetical protein
VVALGREVFGDRGIPIRLRLRCAGFAGSSRGCIDLVHLPIMPISRFGMADQSKLLDYCLRPKAVGRRFVEQIRSDEEDYFVLKPVWLTLLLEREN